MTDSRVKTKKISVIVPTFNEERNIKKCLQSIKNQTYKNIELLVIDSARSTDKTKQIAKNFTKKIFTFGNERSPQRNFGAKKATGEYLLFVDADMQLEKTVVSELAAEFSIEKNITAVVIPEKSFGENYWARCKALERNCYIGDASIEAARCFTKEIFTKVGGYNEQMISGEDWDLSNKIKKTDGKIGRIESYIYHNEGKLYLLKDLRKKLYYAKVADNYIQENVTNFKDVILFIFRPAYFRNWKLLILDPVHLPGFLLMKFLEIGVGAFGAILLKRSFWKKILPSS